MGEIHLKSKSDIHVARKAFHVIGVVSIVIIHANVSHVAALQLITLTALLSLSIDVLRRYSPLVNKYAIRIMSPIMRQSERNGFTGTTFLFLGVFAIILIFPKKIVALSLLFLAFADPIAGYIGIHYGRDKIWGKKSLQGTMAAFVACTLITAIYCHIHNLMTDRILIVSLLSGLAGSVAELLQIGKIDDNFTLPILSASSLWVIFYVFGGLS